MIEELRRVLERFPEDEETIRQLLQNNDNFKTLCKEYNSIDQELQGADAERTTELKHLQASLEEEMLRVIEGYQPV